MTTGPEDRMAELARAAAALSDRADDPELRALLAEMEALAALLPGAAGPFPDEDAEALFDNMPV